METTKCASCGVNLSGGIYKKSKTGTYLCLACHKEERQTRICSICNAKVMRNECHKNRYGEYVCKMCGAVGKKHSNQYDYRDIIPWIIGAIVLVAAAIRYFDNLVSMFFPPQE